MSRVVSSLPLSFCLLLAYSRFQAPECAADTLTCARVGSDRVVVDGMLDDWRGIRCSRIGGTDEDRSLDLRCAEDGRRLFLSVNIRDERMRRTKKSKAKSEDHLDIRLSVAGGKAVQLRMFPGFGNLSPKRTWGGGRVPKQVEVEDTRQKRGWSAEVSIPLAKIHGWSRGTPALAARVSFADADAQAKIAGRATFDGKLQFSGAAASFRSFLKAVKLRRSDIRLDVMADVDGMPGAERVVAGGRVIGILTDEFSYMTLPVASADDVVLFKVVDLAGEGTSAIIAQFREHGQTGTREVVGIWYVGGRGFERVLAFEVKKEAGDRLLTNKWSLVPKGKYRKLGRGESKRGHDLLVEAGEARGWDEDNYQEIPAHDVKPILLPWEDRTSAVYYFQGNVVLGGDPKTSRR